ncbi:GLPGLI family protein [Nonlabens sp. Asnod3-A02]|uniref:GLPGLI family protein n=1 Tax=Nonlabens sp. Asnod3-A02 TaxID=3160579 RepID=UPI0038666F89
MGTTTVTISKIFLVTFISLGIYFLNFKNQPEQIEPKSHAFLYKFDFKHHTNRPDLILTDYVVIYKTGDTTFTQFYNQMKRDSIYSHRKMSGQERFNNRVNSYPYSIKTIKNDVVFTSKVSDQYFKYEEQLQFKWNITDSIRKINSYTCQLATTTYAGRSWNAWFTQDIPMDVGPYKFKGLPGCIVEMNDTDNIFKYSLTAFKEKKEVRLTHYPSVTKKPIEITTRKDFNKHQQAFLALSFEQRMAYAGRNRAGIIKSEFKSNDGEVNFKNKSLDLMDDYQFIEIDHIE